MIHISWAKHLIYIHRIHFISFLFVFSKHIVFSFKISLLLHIEKIMQKSILKDFTSSPKVLLIPFSTFTQRCSTKIVKSCCIHSSSQQFYGHDAIVTNKAMYVLEPCKWRFPWVWEGRLFDFSLLDFKAIYHLEEYIAQIEPLAARTNFAAPIIYSKMASFLFRAKDMLPLLARNQGIHWPCPVLLPALPCSQEVSAPAVVP